MSWGEAGPDDPDRWALQVVDTGPGLVPGQGSGVVDALEIATDHARDVSMAHLIADDADVPGVGFMGGHEQDVPSNPGEGIGLSIVKRLCELLDATLQVESGSQGTCFRMLLPTRYPAGLPATAGDEGLRPGSPLAGSTAHSPPR